MKVGFYYYNERPNFGDAINLELLNILNISLDIQVISKDDIENYNVVFLGIGSILTKEILNKRITIILLGSGLRENLLFKNSIYNNLSFVRGPLSSKNTNLPFITDIAYYFGKVRHIEKKHKYGYVTYYGYDNLFFKRIFSLVSGCVLICAGNNDYKTVVEQISTCDKIITSSLHGAIVADTNRVPWFPVFLGNNIMENFETTLFKWKDFTGSMLLRFEFKKISLKMYPQDKLLKKLIKTMIFAILVFFIKYRRNYLLSEPKTSDLKYNQLEVYLGKLKFELNGCLKNCN